MKHICSNEVGIKNHLQFWSNGRHHQVISFFFWAAGTLQQKSYAGFLRTLLYKILKKVPALISVIFEAEWKSLLLTKKNLCEDGIRISADEVRRAFESLITQDFLSLDLCLFIDGLDEYEGPKENPYNDILDLIGRATSPSISPTQRIKVCLSSRPLNEFAHAFYKCPTLRVQDLTRKDIALYVRNTLNYNHLDQKYKLAEDTEMDYLINCIVEKASGVFLWARLSSNSVLNGLKNGDCLDELQAKLDALPSELEDMFKSMLRNAANKDPSYLQQAKNYFQLVESSQNPPCIFVLAFANWNVGSAIQEPCEYWSQAMVQIEYANTERRLKSRCAGLLEVQGIDAHETPNSSEATAISDGTVQYLHRTVRDYLKSADIWPLENKLNYDPHQILLRCHVLKLKKIQPQLGRIWEWTESVYECYYYARQAESTERYYFRLLDELELAILAGRQSLLKQGAEESDFKASGTIIRHMVPPLGIAVWTGLHLYSSGRINPNTIAKLSPPNRPLLYYASCFSEWNDNSSAILDPRIIKLLLDCGTDPNEEIKDPEFFNDSSTTPWRTFLRNVFLAKNVLHDNRDPA